MNETRKIDIVWGWSAVAKAFGISVTSMKELISNSPNHAWAQMTIRRPDGKIGVDRALIERWYDEQRGTE